MFGTSTRLALIPPNPDQTGSFQESRRDSQITNAARSGSRDSYNMRDSELLTSAQSATVLKRTPDNLLELARQGTLPVAIVVGRGQRLYRRFSDVEDLAAQRDAAAVATR